jgi:hypothetical protein
MWPLLQLFIDIAFHRRGPEDVPSVPVLLWLVLGTATLVQLLSLLALNYAAGRAVIETVLHLALTLGAYVLLLKTRGLAARVPQTLIALLGTATLLGVLMLPVVTWMYAGMQVNQVPPLATLAFFVLLIWSIDISGFVLSRALGAHYVIGVLVALGVIAVDTTLRRAILPAL